MGIKDKDFNKNNSFRKLIGWITGVLVLLAIAYFGIGAYVADSAGKREPHDEWSDTPATFGVSFTEEVFIARGDDIMISAWYLPNQVAEKAIILVHGRNASKQNAISGHFPKLGVDLYNAGYSVLMIDTRGHGNSGGERYSFGVYERRDVLGAVDFLINKGITPGNIAALGISNGGAAVIGAASEETAIGPVILDSTLAELNPLIDIELKNKGLPAFFKLGIDMMGRLMFGYSLSSVKPEEEIAKIPPRPILIMHCLVDQKVDVSHAERLYDAAPKAVYVLYDTCSHAELYRDHPIKYIEAVVPFLQQAW